MSHDMPIVSAGAAGSRAIVPVARVPIHVRPGTMDDLPFLDSLQKMHAKMVGWMPTKQFEGKIAAEQVLIADDAARNPLGYVIAQDRYFKRDDVGIVYQLNVAPVAQRKLIGAMLLKAVFDRAAYGCRLFCCWCAQDIEANRFWEAMGFVPLAYRAGSEKKIKGARAHLLAAANPRGRFARRRGGSRPRRMRGRCARTGWCCPSRRGCTGATRCRASRRTRRRRRRWQVGTLPDAQIGTAADAPRRRNRGTMDW